MEEAARYRDFREERGHRAIGVVYHPDLEHLGNYVPTVLSRRYDAFIYLGVFSAFMAVLAVGAYIEEKSRDRG